MSNLNNRVKQLEKESGANVKYKYMCLIYKGKAIDNRPPEEKAKGYKIQPFIPSAGGTGGAVFYLQTEQELKDFATRPDVDLMILVIRAASEAAQDG